MQTDRIKHFFLAALVLLTGLWVAAEPKWWPEPLTYFAFRATYMQYSGAIAIGVMSVAMILALRPRWLEPHLKGLDKMYRLHKWLGITALVVSVLHWWLGQGTKWMVGWGWLVRPARGPRPSPADQGVIEAWLGSQRGLAETVGEWAFYAAAVLMVLALVKRFPYRWFAKTHTFLAAFYLALVFHSGVLIRFSYWSQPLGWLLAGLMAAGSVAAVLVLFRQVGAGRKVPARVEALTHYPALDVLETRLRVEDGWRGHDAGQFAFMTTDASEGAHPYTIASAWDPKTREIVFITKALGDHTRRLRELLRVGSVVTLEGPYGRFTFDDARSHQVWVGAGVGITPFVARMKQLAGRPPAERPGCIDLFHPTAVYEPAAIERLRADAAAAGVQLHVMVDAQDGYLSGERIRTVVPGWAQASFWFCGPEALSRALVDDLSLAGVPRAAFHQELFQMR